MTWTADIALARVSIWLVAVLGGYALSVCVLNPAVARAMRWLCAWRRAVAAARAREILWVLHTRNPDALLQSELRAQYEVCVHRAARWQRIARAWAK